MKRSKRILCQWRGASAWSKALLPLAAVVVALMAVALALAGPPKQDTLTVTAKTSSGGFTPTIPGNSPTEWFYAYCVPSGVSLSDTLPVDFTVTDTDNSPGDSYTISLSATGSNALKSKITLPADFTISDDGSTTTQSIQIGPVSLSDGNYAVTIHISGSPSNKLNVPVSNIHIHVAVGGACGGPNPSCFLTDSSFNLLTDCSGNAVAGNSGGTFVIVTNSKGYVVATNPGQFYYNMIWNNTTGSDQTVTVTFQSSNLSPMGANSVHALVFDSSGFTEDLSSFDMVNQNGTPCGPSGPCTISVPAGQILWVTWHLTYTYIGQKAIMLNLSSTCSESCSPDYKGYISATGTLSFDSTSLSCTATACGYLKRQ